MADAVAEPAPFFEDVAEGPPGGRAYWVTATDGVRVRAVLWPEGAKGTVLTFNGRTECCEKYGRTARDLAAHGFAAATIDWRGQGLADRLAPDRQLGHVGAFVHYQRDVAALIALVRAQGLPQPYFLLAHSMGGCIGLRALLDELPVRAAAFSAPMWGIQLSPVMRPAAWATSWLADLVGQGTRLSPGRSLETYVIAEPFEGNDLTTDPDYYAYMRVQVEQEPDLGLGGPSLHWLREALLEMRALAVADLPDMPVLVGLGTAERIVDPRAIHAQCARWPSARLTVFDRAEHELLMERAAVREAFTDQVAALFSAQV